MNGGPEPRFQRPHFALRGGDFSPLQGPRERRVSLVQIKLRMRGLKIPHGKLGQQLGTAREWLRKPLVKLAAEHKHLTDIIKILAYQTESDLPHFPRPHYSRAEQEGRTLLHELIATVGDIHIKKDELRITLAPLSSPHRTRALPVLCELLDQTATVSPGTRLPLRFAIHTPPHIGRAFHRIAAGRGTTTAPGSTRNRPF